MQPHLPCCNVMQLYTLIQEFSMRFYFSSGQIGLLIELFCFQLRVIYDEWRGFLFFIQVFHHEVVDTDQVSLMINLSDFKQNPFSTCHGYSFIKINLVQLHFSSLAALRMGQCLSLNSQCYNISIKGHFTIFKKIHVPCTQDKNDQEHYRHSRW